MVDEKVKGKGSAKFSVSRLLPLLVICAIGLLISVAAFLFVLKTEQARRLHIFYNLTEPVCHNAISELEGRVSDLLSIACLFDGTENVSRDEFRRFASNVAKGKPELALMAWLPLVDEAGRKAFEGETQAKGLPDFHIYEKAQDGASNVPAKKEGVHVPYYYVWPVEGNAALIGFDTWSETRRREFLEEACSRGSPLASTEIPMVPEALHNRSQAIVLCAPVYKIENTATLTTTPQRREALKGFAVLILRPDILLKELCGASLAKSAAMTLFESKQEPPGENASFLSGSLQIRKDFAVAGRKFTLLCTPREDFFKSNPLITPWLVLALGLMLTGALAALLLYRELQLGLFDKTILRNAGDLPELRDASRIRVKIVIAVAVALALMLVWFILWTQHELTAVGSSATLQNAYQAVKIWKNLAADDEDFLRTVYSSAISDEAFASAWRSRDRSSLLKKAMELAASAKLNGPGDSVEILGLDRRCLARSDKPESYGDLNESRMLVDAVGMSKMVCGLAVESDGSIKTSLCAPYPDGAGGPNSIGFLVLTKNALPYVSELRRISGCEFLLALLKKNIDERRWLLTDDSSRGLRIWDNSGEFIPAFQGALSNRAVMETLQKIGTAKNAEVVKAFFGEQSWYCASLPLEDYSEREFGRLVTFRDVSQDLATQRKTLAFAVAGAVALAIALLLAIATYASAVERRLFIAVVAREREEDNLEVLKDRLSSTLHSIGDGVIATDIKGCVTDMNAVAENLTGWTLAEASGRRIEAVFNLINSETRQRAEIPVERVLRESRMVGLANHSAVISKSGVERQIADSAAPIRNRSGEVIGTVLVFRDVTDDYKMREDLRKSEARFRLLAENSRDAIFLISVPAANFEYISPAAKDITGYHPEEFYAKNGFLRGIVHKDDLEIFSDAMSSAFAGHPLQNVEFRVIRKDGRVIWISSKSSVIRDASGRITAIQGLASDITSRKTMEDALRKSEELYRTLVDNIDLGIVLIGVDRRIIMVNRHMTMFYNKDRGYFIGRLCHEVLEGQQKICEHCPVSEAIKSGEPSEKEFDLILPDGRVRRMRNRAFPLKDKDGSITSFIEIVNDITETNQAEVRKQQLEQQLLQSQKMESIGRLAGGIAHDFNNMLTPILGYADMILKKPIADDPKTRSRIEQILNAATRARDLTKQLLAMARKQTMQLRSLNLNEVISNFEHILRRTIREDITLELNLAPNLGSLQGDSGQLEQVILNLALNAQDAMPSGGLLKLSTAEACVDEQMAQTHDGAKVGMYIRLRVSDSGAGIPKEMLNKIFEPFFTTKPQGKGTGLGLSTVYGVTRQHGGFIDVKSEPGFGSVFDIFIPRSGDPLPTISLENDHLSDTSSLMDQSPGGTECILLAEDQQNVLEMVAEMLQAKGYSVIPAPDGLKAFDAASEFKGTIQLLLTDMVMPGMNGKALYDKVKENRPDIKVLFMSGYTNNLLGGNVHERNLAFIQKPFTLDRLACKIREVLDS